jgi:hypothetical protein
VVRYRRHSDRDKYDRKMLGNHKRDSGKTIVVARFLLIQAAIKRFMGEAQLFAIVSNSCFNQRRGGEGGDYSPERTIGGVGVFAPPAFSIVMPKPFAGTPLGSCGSTTEAKPSAFGRKVPAAMGDVPLAGITQSS